jgi:hypothetical protein
MSFDNGGTCGISGGNMKQWRCSKRGALSLFCVFRQGERSIHFALSSPVEWAQLRSFYDFDKRKRISAIIDDFRRAGIVSENVSAPRSMITHGLISMAMRMAGLICNRFKCNWTFRLQEAEVFGATLARLLKTVQYVSAPETDELIQLRLDCFYCHYAIRQRLIGLSELRKANSIEHFNQSLFTEHFSFHDLGLDQNQCHVG